MLSGQRASRLLALCGALVAVSCSSGPPTQPAPVTPTPTPAPTVAACTASAPQPMTSFTADPATITDGDLVAHRCAADRGAPARGRRPSEAGVPLPPRVTKNTGVDAAIPV